MLCTEIQATREEGKSENLALMALSQPHKAIPGTLLQRATQTCIPLLQCDQHEQQQGGGLQSSGVADDRKHRAVEMLK